MIFESHAHYEDPRFDEDRDMLLSSMLENGITVIVDVMAEMSGLEKVKGLCERYPFIYASAGVHPSEIYELNLEDMEKVRNFSRHEKCVAIGEIGLDYNWDTENKEQQRYWFEYQAEIARQEGLPVIIHSRDAAEDTVDIIREIRMDEIGAVMHCFSYSREIAKICLDMGLYLGIGGVVTFKNSKKIKEAVEYAPMDRILLETDSPYLAPEPYRGKRNSSLYLPYVVEKIAEIKGLTTDQVEQITYENARRFFKI